MVELLLTPPKILARDLARASRQHHNDLRLNAVNSHRHVAAPPTEMLRPLRPLAAAHPTSRVGIRPHGAI